MAREINLVPDIKNEMLKTLKLRNLIFFVCFIVAIASAGVTLFFGTIMLGQKAAVDGKASTIEKLSNKLNSYSDLDDFLTIKDQLGNITTLSNNKKVLSRTFNTLSTILAAVPSEGDVRDSITVSSLNVSLAETAPTFSFDAQADANVSPYNNWNTLDIFKKNMPYLRYDYGDYYDKDGNMIPAYCIIDTNSEGTLLNESGKGYYAYWTINGNGCDPTKDKKDNEQSNNTSEESEDEDTNANTDTTPSVQYQTEEYNDQQVVRIWRTPQAEWHKDNPSENEVYMTSDGEVKNTPYFKSKCITYTWDSNSKNPGWVGTNDNCRLISEITISDQSQGRDSNGELVLRFAAKITLDPTVYQFSAHHIRTYRPNQRINLTDSFIQLNQMFAERAKDCEKDDPECGKQSGGNN